MPDVGDYYHMLQEIDESESDLSDWERGFLDSNLKRFETYGSSTMLSDKQTKVIERIWEKTCG